MYGDGYMDLKLFLEDLFGGPVDLVIAEGIKPRLRESILIRDVVYAAGF
jgi:predicted nucleotidyltransferase